MTMIHYGLMSIKNLNTKAVFYKRKWLFLSPPLFKADTFKYNFYRKILEGIFALKILGAIIAFFLTDFLFHLIDALAFGMKANTQAERIGAVFFGVCVLLILMAIFHRFFSKAFFHGFTVATGLFLSFDIVVFHWIFQLHRITSGPEANWLEPLFVLSGSLLVWYGISKERFVNNNQKNLHI